MSLETLLAQISGITKKYQEIQEDSGEHFNIFDILHVSADELSHSRIIAALLNPAGDHGKGDTFLKLFLECMDINDFQAEDARVETEKSIGTINDDHDSGGRIDILLTDKNRRQIIIENKIYATEQKNQLLRYHNYNPEAHLLYLTLQGDDPDGEGAGEKSPIPYKKISYREHILRWLELCKKEAVNKPLARETLVQYEALIQQLTGKKGDRKMQKEYMDAILNNADNVSAALIVAENINEIKLRLLEDKFLPIISGLAKNLKLDWISPLKNRIEPYWGFSLKKSSWKNFSIDFEFQKQALGDLIYGSCCKNPPAPLDAYLRGLNYRHSRLWPMYQYMEKYRNWDHEFFSALYVNPDDIKNVFEDKITDILYIVENSGCEL